MLLASQSQPRLIWKVYSIKYLLIHYTHVLISLKSKTRPIASVLTVTAVFFFAQFIVSPKKQLE